MNRALYCTCNIGLGALIVHSRALHTMKKTFFGGGTVEMFSPSCDYHVLRNSFHERYLNVVLYTLIEISKNRKYQISFSFEDGTSNFLAIVSLGTGLREFKVCNIKHP